MWAHRSYNAGYTTQTFLAITGAACFQGSIQEWSRDHRAHHRYVDTDRDPYSIKRGFWHAHMGWLFLETKVGTRPVDVTDLHANPIVAWQSKYFLSIAITAGLIFPSLVAGILWNDWWGGLIYAGILRIFFFQQATFCVNSLAHSLGHQPYDDKHSPRDHIFTALVTFGEGYHNFHHEFPSDYRNGIKWNQYDPTKWFIWTCEKLGLVTNLRRFSRNQIHKSEYQQRRKRLDTIRSTLDWGTPPSQMPLMTWEEFQKSVEYGLPLLCVAGFIYNVESFIIIHPGGPAAIRSYIGKDATTAFNGGMYSRMLNHNPIFSQFVLTARKRFQCGS